MNTKKAICIVFSALLSVLAASQANAQLRYVDLSSSYNLWIPESEPVEQHGTFEFRPNSRELTINGTSADDDIIVRLSSTGINVEHYYFGRLLFSKLYKPYQISKIVFHGEAGDDSFRIFGMYYMYSGQVMFDCDLYGGDGFDVLYGGFGDDLLDGGADWTEDYLVGYGGADRFITHTYKNGYYREYENVADFDFYEGDHYSLENAD